MSAMIQKVIKTVRENTRITLTLPFISIELKDEKDNPDAVKEYQEAVRAYQDAVREPLHRIESIATQRAADILHAEDLMVRLCHEVSNLIRTAEPFAKGGGNTPLKKSEHIRTIVGLASVKHFLAFCASRREDGAPPGKALLFELCDRLMRIDFDDEDDVLTEGPGRDLFVEYCLWLNETVFIDSALKVYLGDFAKSEDSLWNPGGSIKGAFDISKDVGALADSEEGGAYLTFFGWVIQLEDFGSTIKAMIDAIYRSAERKNTTE